MTDQSREPTTSTPHLASDDGPTLADLLGILRRRKALILLVTIALTAPPAAYGLMIEPEYTAATTVLIEPRAPRIINVQEVVPTPSPNFVSAEAEADVIRSRGIAVQALHDLGLSDDPEFQPRPEGDEPRLVTLAKQLTVSLATWAGEIAARNLPASAAAASGTTGAAAASPRESAALPVALVAAEPGNQQQQAEDAAELFAQRLAVDQVGQSFVLRVSFTSRDPAKAARIVNRVTELYLQSQLASKLRATRKANAWLSERLSAMEKEVLVAERGVSEFRAENQLVAEEKGQAMGAVQAGEVLKALIEARAARAEKEAKLRLIGSLKGSATGLDTMADVMASPVIENLRRQEAELARKDAELASSFGERHPQRLAMQEERARLEDRITEEVNRIVQGMRNSLTVLATQERDLSDQLQAANSRSARDDQAEVRLRQLEREAAAKRTLYETMLNRYQETSTQEGILEPDSRVISEADVPTDPSTPSPLIFAAVGFTASTVFGCMAALIREQMDKRLRCGRHVEHFLQARSLGLVPNASPPRRGALHDLLVEAPRSSYTQAVRALYTQLTVSRPRPRVILVTSALPNEGKTSLAASLAVCAAELGRERALLIDFDVWNPSVAKAFKLPRADAAEGRELGGALRSAVVRDDRTGIDILAVRGDTAERMFQLMPQPVDRLLRDARASYDWIVIDSPPLLGVNDARILALHADTTIFAVRWAHTNRDAAAAGLRILRDVSAAVAGVVLTRVDLKRHARDGQGDGLEYYREFRRYYSA